MTTAIALFSGGLDSILACRVVAAQGIRVVAVHFVTPFFGYDLLADAQGFSDRVREKYGIEAVLRDVSRPYLEMLRNPPHGYGKNFNPCIDCKILLMQEARRMMADYSASFLISGEVLGQRPMSQRKDTLRVIERDSGCEGILLRPLCAKSQKPTIAELDGLIDREQLLDFRGRTRQPQMELAARLGITDYPSPAGGCVLTDPTLGKRIERFYGEHPVVTVQDIRLLMVGRNFRLPHGATLVVGRKQEENERIAALVQPDDYLVKMIGRPGPTAILRNGGSEDDLAAAAGLVVRFGKKVEGDATAQVSFIKAGDERIVKAGPLPDREFAGWYR